ncbi:MAG: nitrous oxide reductase family maturation protein NosD [Phycisphaerales bacterium]|nr:nitrous oxide reductase family maturation protein NosD [Phycisphaerales bacterium]
MNTNRSILASSTRRAAIAATITGCVNLFVPPSLAQDAMQPPTRPPAAAPTTRDSSGVEINAGTLGTLIIAAKTGDTIHVPAGVYREHIRIDKPLSLIAEGHVVIDGMASGDIVEICAPNVTFRGFIVRDTGIDLDKENAAIRVLADHAVIENNTLEDILFGIDLKQASDAIVRGNFIGGKDLDIARRGDGLRLWRSDRTLIEHNTIHDGRDAILWYSQNVTVRGNTSRRCRYGFHLMFSDNVVMENNELTHNSVGIYLMYSKGVTLRGNRLLSNRGPSGYGIGLKETDQFSITDNLIAANRAGVYLDGSPFTNLKPGDISHNTIACNDVGITFLPSVRGNIITANNFVDNIEQVCVSGRGELRGNDFAANDRGNFWTDYAGYDADADGIGDFAHESVTLFENLLDREPKLRLLLFSPAQQAIEFVGRAIPAIRPEPKFFDPAPLTAPVLNVTNSGPAPSRLSLAICGLGLVSVASLVYFSSRAFAVTTRRKGAVA